MGRVSSYDGQWAELAAVMDIGTVSGCDGQWAELAVLISDTLYRSRNNNKLFVVAI